MFAFIILSILILILLGGLFAGLTIGLMSLEPTNLLIMMRSGSTKERKEAARVFPLRQKGHWLLTSLLLSNVAVNEALPILLNQLVQHDYLSIILSTIVIVLFGEIIPNAICSRYGLTIGSHMSWFVFGLLYLTFPISWPLSKLLDWFIGEEEFSFYRKEEIKTLLELHEQGRERSRQISSHVPSQVRDHSPIESLSEEPLDHEQVIIMHHVLDLSSKNVGKISTPLSRVYKLNESQILTRELLEEIKASGFSRIPVCSKNKADQLHHILLVKKLLGSSLDRKIKDFELNAMPLVLSTTGLFEMLNYFQQGKSHMATVIDAESGKLLE